MSFPKFMLLAEELRLEILGQLPTTDLLSFSRASKACHSLALPIIYSTVDIRETAQKIWCWGGVLENQQCQLFRTLKEHPEYYGYIQNLRFYVGAQFMTDRIPPKPFETTANEEPDEDDSYPEDWIEPLLDSEFYVWVFLEKCTSAKHVDLLFKYSIPPQNGFPDTLFPSASHLQISGVMDWALLQALFHGSITTPLNHLGLDLVEHRGIRILDGKPPNSPLPISTNDIYERLRPDLHPENQLEYLEQSSGLSKVRHFPGSVLGVLPLAAPRCTKLKSLFIRKPGKRCDEEAEFPETTDISFLRELGEVIQAAKDSLRELTLIQAGIYHRRNGWATFPLTIAAARFEDLILPVLVSGVLVALEDLMLVGCGVSKSKGMEREILSCCPRLASVSSTEETPIVKVRLEYPGVL